MSAGLRFTEQMRGWVAFGEDDCERGATLGREDRTTLHFRLTMEIDDLDAFLADPRRTARARGWIRCEAIGGRLDVESGVFNLFAAAGEPGVRHMLYRMFFRDPMGRPLTLSGRKVVRNDRGADLWPDTSTLHTKLLGGHVSPDDEPHAEIVAAGIMRITPRGFLKLLTTVRHTAPSHPTGVVTVLRFGLAFMRELVSIYAPRPRT